MQLYLYSSENLIIKGESFINFKANTVYCLTLSPKENIYIYSAATNGVIVINYEILINQQHNQIMFHKLNETSLLCEIKPFMSNEKSVEYSVLDSNLKLIKNLSGTDIYFNGEYYGNVKCDAKEISFEEIKKNNNEYGIVLFKSDKKHMIVFDCKTIIYCGKYCDYEILKDSIQIYVHNPNIFNTGQLVNYSFASRALQVKTVQDCEEERVQLNSEFNAIYFIEAIKCGRFKYAYNKLSYELKAAIDVGTLQKYFKEFNEYIYISELDIFITLNNNKIIGVYNIKTKNNLIYNIY